MSSFVVFGNLERTFERMSKAVVDSYALFPKPLIIQAGANCQCFEDPPAGITVFQSCSFSDFSDFISHSSVVVTHGGVGSIKEAALAGLCPGVFVRKGSKREHIDDHQVEWCDSLFAANIATEMHDSLDLNNFLRDGVHFQRDILAARRFFDDSILRSAVHAFIRSAMQKP